ncbi:MAG: peptidoglycan DD-metalloendopeptidase family protein, partial [Gammaproteobacteria bacterium]
GMKGKLAWPATGRLVQLFGTKLKNSNQISRGVTIRAQEGGDVRVISHGRVAFADWLRGFGLLLIIDHGDGFMSLYGHNQSLYKEVGEWVDTGDVVSVLGSSGAQANSGLYFELRHEGSPVDPLKWCQGKPG